MNPSRSDRREFLRSSSALVLGGIGAIAQAAQDEPAVRVAVVGTGARGSDLIRNLSTIERAQLVAVCDDYPPHLARGQHYAGPQAKAYASYAKMLEEAAPQAVVVATPLHLHSQHCLLALDAGCQVFCEKTMCYSLDQAQSLAAAVKKRNAVFQVGLQRRANAVYRQAAAMVETGMLGRITAIQCQWHRNNNWRRPVPGDRVDAAWPALERRLNWRLYREFSQGLLAELASHQLDVANQLLGCLPRRVIGSGGIDYWRDGREVFDNVFCTYEYELTPKDPIPTRRVSEDLPEKAGPKNEHAKPDHAKDPYTVRVTYSSIQNNAFEGASELVLGTKGTLFLTQKKGLFYREAGVDNPGWSKEGRVEDDSVLVTSGKTLKMNNDPWSHRGPPFEIDTDSDDTRDELVAFLSSVQRRDPATLCDVQAGLGNTATVLLGNLAMQSRTAVEFPETL